MQLAMEAGAKRILLPNENKRNRAEVPNAILAAIQWQLYDRRPASSRLTLPGATSPLAFNIALAWTAPIASRLHILTPVR
jgi:hypothetical protein